MGVGLHDAPPPRARQVRDLGCPPGTTIPTFGAVTIDRSGSEPLWTQVLADLRRRIDAGELRDTFPTDLELTAHYGVSRHTVREAVRHLSAEGIISRERGRGTFITSPTIEQATGAIYSLYRSIEESGLRQRSEVLDLSVVTDAEVAERLDLGATDPLVRLERVRFAGDDPLAHDTAWLPASIARPLLSVDFADTALYDELSARCGVRPSSGTEWINTEVPSAAEQGLLGIDEQTAVFRICRSSRAGERAIEWRETLVRGDRYTFVANWSPTGTYQAVLTAGDHPR